MNEALDSAIELLKKFEGCRLKAYRDWVGNWTIGWGETANVKEGDVLEQSVADEMLRRRVTQFMVATIARCPQLLSEPPSRVAACVSFSYNVGVGGWAASSVQRRTRRREYAAAADSFLLWNKADRKSVV